MYKTITRKVVKEVEESIPVCDLCKTEFEYGDTQHSSCPSQQVIMRLFLGYVGYNPMTSSVYATYNGQPQMFGLDLGDICIKCRQDWFKDLKKTFPKAREVKMND